VRSNRQDTRSISEQAAEWLCILSEQGDTDQSEFLEWLRESPRHVEEFLIASATFRKLGEVGVRQPRSVDQILAEISTPGIASNVVPLGRDALSAETRIASASDAPAVRAPRRYYLRFVAGIAALALAGFLGQRITSYASTYSTERGEQRTVSLQDGSVLYLNTDSRARVRFSGKSRQIQLLNGEALFVVAHDPVRPFLVHTDDAVVQAVGTQFNVRRLSANTRVSVIDGHVKVARETASAPSSKQVEFLAAGEEATIADSGRIVKAKVSDVSRAIAWRERRLVFKAEPLSTVVNEINRYSARQFRVEGERARQTLLTATVDADHPEALAAFLRQYADLSVEDEGDGFVIRER
jgi:transmembrane sensor